MFVAGEFGGLKSKLSGRKRLIFEGGFPQALPDRSRRSEQKVVYDDHHGVGWSDLVNRSHRTARVDLGKDVEPCSRIDDEDFYAVRVKIALDYTTKVAESQSKKSVACFQFAGFKLMKVDNLGPLHLCDENFEKHP
jgi:hypothetical protein